MRSTEKGGEVVAESSALLVISIVQISVVSSSAIVKVWLSAASYLNKLTSEIAVIVTGEL